ncbi:MAG: S8 family peptidase [Acidimicrobiales bacterium]
MRRSRLMALLVMGAAASMGIALGVPASSATVAAPARTVVRTTEIPRAVGPTSRVIVMLRDRESGLGARSVARAHALRVEQVPLVQELRVAGAKSVIAGTALPFVIASVTAAQRAALAANPLVVAVAADSVIPYPTTEVPTGATAPGSAGTERPTVDPPSICGTAASPESDPEAINVINASAATGLGYDGAGVTVAYIADGVNPSDPDFSRNTAYASAGSPAGSPVVVQKNFNGDATGTATAGGEAFLDSSSIAAQGNTVYNLDGYVNAADPLPSPCDIKITGAAPGANVMGLDVFSTDHDTTESNFIQAIDYAVAHGAKVINESFGSNTFPDLALDITRIADDDAVAAGVTVVVSSGDSGVTSTIGSPATDPNLISVGASTTFRSYQQVHYGGINASTPDATNGTWIDNNISSLSSGGYSQSGGNTVDLVAPGDLNWALCDADNTLFTDCTNEQTPVTGSDIELSGGTSESSPLTAAAAADVIQAYASTHHGTDPTPALVKQILVSTATDIDAPAEQQGAGLLNVLAAAKEAASIKVTTAKAQGGLLVSPNQVNIVQDPGASTSKTIDVTNNGASSVTVKLSTRALTNHVATQSGSFCLDPATTSISCGPPTANSFSIWSGVTEVYQEETFTVPTTTSPSRLSVSADYPYTEQSSVMHVALFNPSGAYAGYSLPQGLADFANIQVANPAAGTWTAVFFTEKNGATSGGIGTSGTIQWQAITSEFAPAGTISPSTLTIPHGSTSTAKFTAKSPATSGDTSQSIVLRTVGGATNTVPVTVRTMVPIGKNGGTFKGVLTGGNGRGNPAQMNSYVFDVPKGLHDVDVSAAFGDTNDAVAAFLLDPEGEAVASSSSVTVNSKDTGIISTRDVNVYKDAPQAGAWTLVLDWLSPVSGSELSESFDGAVRFDQVSISSSLPKSTSTELKRGKHYSYDVTVKNTGLSPEAFFVDPRTSGTASVALADQNGSAQGMSLPLAPGTTFPIYLVPADTSGISASLTGNVPVTFDTEPFTGDPDLSPDVAAPGVKESQSGDKASLRFTTSGEVMPGYWYLNPSEIGPYGSTGAPAATATAVFDAITQAFDPTVKSSTGDLWSAANGLSKGFTPVYVMPGKSAKIVVTITPTAASGKTVSGVINVDDTFLANELIGVTDSGGDELASLPYTYKVS